MDEGGRGEWAYSGHFFFRPHLLANYSGSENYKCCRCWAHEWSSQLPQNIGVDVNCKRGRSENIGPCQKSESTPPVGRGRAELCSGTMRLNYTRGQN